MIIANVFMMVALDRVRRDIRWHAAINDMIVYFSRDGGISMCSFFLGLSGPSGGPISFDLEVPTCRTSCRSPGVGVYRGKRDLGYPHRSSICRVSVVSFHIFTTVVSVFRNGNLPL